DHGPQDRDPDEIAGAQGRRSARGKECAPRGPGLPSPRPGYGSAHGGDVPMRFRKTAIALIAAAAIGVSATAGAHGLGRGDITGYPNQIRMVDLAGYQIVTSYTLGRNTG